MDPDRCGWMRFSFGRSVVIRGYLEFGGNRSVAIRRGKSIRGIGASPRGSAKAPDYLRLVPIGSDYLLLRVKGTSKLEPVLRGNRGNPEV